MANEITIPLLPCGSIDTVADFYRMLGFEVTYRQTRPNPYLAVRREDIHLHFFGMDGFDPEQSYGSCLVQVPDTGALFASFADGMRATHGKLLTAGIPRMTRPRKQQDHTMGFVVVDPGGNWIRIMRANRTGHGSKPTEPPTSKLARTLHNATVLGDSKGDHRQAARILDAALARDGEAAGVVDRVQALVYRAELAIKLHDGDRADALLAQVRGMPLEDGDREWLGDALANAGELELARHLTRQG